VDEDGGYGRRRRGTAVLLGQRRWEDDNGCEMGRGLGGVSQLGNSGGDHLRERGVRQSAAVGRLAWVSRDLWPARF
jgi:hypothetical protein